MGLLRCDEASIEQSTKHDLPLLYRNDGVLIDQPTHVPRRNGEVAVRRGSTKRVDDVGHVPVSEELAPRNPPWGRAGIEEAPQGLP